MKYSIDLMNDLIRWYGLEGHPEMQLARNHTLMWRCHAMRIRLAPAYRRGIKSCVLKLGKFVPCHYSP